MEKYDWLLFLHLLGAFVGAAAMVALWVLTFATRPGAEALDGPQADRFGKIAGPMVGGGFTVALVFGVWLTLDLDGYDLLDGWILASLVLWLLAAATGGKSGKIFMDPDGDRATAIRLQTVATAAFFVILVLMIWKPGA